MSGVPTVHGAATARGVAAALGVAAAFLLAVPPDALAARTPPPSPAAAARLLERYRAAIAALPKPANMVFMYTEMRADPQRIVTSAHRVYRNEAGEQRNDTVEVNGIPVRPPRTQTYQRAQWPYYADAFAVSPADYDARFTGVATIDGRRTQSYAVKRLTSAPFSITELDLDPASALPVRERFIAATRDCDARGSIDFAPSGSYWLPTNVSVECSLSGASASAGYKNTIRFADYRFPVTIPADVLHPSGANTP
jgi:hypothetical protein